MLWNRRALWIYLVVVVMVLLSTTAIFGKRKYDQYRADQTFRKDLFITNLPNVPAPNFTLTDQKGKQVSLSDFRGKPVALISMDPVCEDVCLLVSREVQEAENLLGAKASHITFLAVNVNPDYTKVSDVAQFTDQHSLDRYPNWYFVTGSVQQLKPIWKKYGVSVSIDNSGQVNHSSMAYFINSKGNEVLLAETGADKYKVNEWGKAMAFYLKQLH